MPEQRELGGFFDDYLTRGSLFNNKSALQPAHRPKKIIHREEQIDQLQKIIAPALRLERPSNIFIYGKTGTGKSATVTKVIEEELQAAATKNNIPITTLSVNCKLKRVADTEYRLLSHITHALGADVVKTGLATEEIYRAFITAAENKKGIIILILDEFDYLLKKVGDDILYTLTRLNERELKQAQLCIIGISNDLLLADNLDPRVKSSLSEEEILFPPYNALQLRDILLRRSKKAFKKESLGPGVIEKCAAYAAREHGDSRRALDLLRVAGEIAERNGQNTITIKNVDDAEAKIERDRVFDTIITQPQQVQLTLYAIISSHHQKKQAIFTGEVYEVYKRLCHELGFRPLTQRRLSDVIAELDMFGIINARIISKGRYGRTREIFLSISPSIIPKTRAALEDALGIGGSRV